MAKNSKVRDSVSEDLILKMIAQDLDAEDQLPFGKVGEHALGGLTEDNESIRPVNDHVAATSNSHEDRRTDQQLLPHESLFSRPSSETRVNSNDRQPETCDSTFFSCSPSAEIKEACSASTTLPFRKILSTTDADKHNLLLPPLRQTKAFTICYPQPLESWTTGREKRTSLPMEEQHEYRFRSQYNDPPDLDQIQSDSLSIANIPNPSTWTSPQRRGRTDAKSGSSTYKLDDPSDSPCEHDIFAPAYLEQRHAGRMAEIGDRVVRYKGVEYTLVIIPWAGKPAWVEREVDRSFEREELRKAMGGGRALRSAKQMERVRRREEEATVAEIEVGDDETLDSIITGMIAKEHREKKGKSKAAD